MLTSYKTTAHLRPQRPWPAVGRKPLNKYIYIFILYMYIGHLCLKAVFPSTHLSEAGFKKTAGRSG